MGSRAVDPGGPDQEVSQLREAPGQAPDLPGGRVHPEGWRLVRGRVWFLDRRKRREEIGRRRHERKLGAVRRIDPLADPVRVEGQDRGSLIGPTWIQIRA